mmetsp:Transcript_139130/g.196973  ORF Transcript_139130/g.196973 Transcript_139130/m.196973 type:complete len:206 (+) Transcript_139130:383-1000(+)
MPFMTSSRFKPRTSTPMLSPASPRSSVLWNISIPVTVVFKFLPYPTSSISSPFSTTPLSQRPVMTVPRPAMEYAFSIGNKNSLSRSRVGSGIHSSQLTSSSLTRSSPSSGLRPSSAQRAEPHTIGVSSPSNLYSESRSLISISTSSSNSSSSTISALLINTQTLSIPTCFARSKCSRVCGICPSSPETTSMAPSICAAPVIIFFT